MAHNLAQFGSAALRQGYQMYGADDQVLYCSPSNGSCDHLVYMYSRCFQPHTGRRVTDSLKQLPDDFKDEYLKMHGKHATQDRITFIKRELSHAVWHLLLSGRFEEAYRVGVVIRCPDGIERRFFPRILHYYHSADDP